MGTAIKPAIVEEPADFSPIIGGPLINLYRRMHLAGESLEFLTRRVLVVSGIAWLPLLLLALVEHHSVAGSGALPFWYDIDVHVRLLIAVPVFMGAEVFVHKRTRTLVRKFVERRIIVPEDMPKFRTAVESALKVRNSVALELLLVVGVYTIGAWVWRDHVALLHPTWYATNEGSHLRLTVSGYWFVFVSIPVVQFMLVRWYARLCIWFWLLWRISRLNLHLLPTHPDHVGGIGFLGGSSYAFSPVLFAQGCLLSGGIANRVIFEKESLLNFKTDAVLLVVVLVVFILFPLLMFTPKLDAAKHKGGGRFGLLATDYVVDFEKKWTSEDSAQQPTNLLGSNDIQALADLSVSYTVVERMRVVPFKLDDITRLAAATAAPLVPLALLVMPMNVLLKQLLKLIFHF